MTTQALTPGSDPAATLRLDKWLWHARFFKSRSRAAAFCAEGRLRLNGRIVSKASAVVRAEDVLTFPHASGIRVVRIVALGVRRGPPGEARTLYADLVPAETGGQGVHRAAEGW